MDAGLSYGGWDECVPGVAEGAAPVLVDASGLQNLANLAEAPTTELGAAATEVDMRVEPAVEVDEAKTDVQVEVLDLSSLKEEVLDLSSFKEEVPAEEAATELTEVDEAATEVPAASKAEKPPPDTMRVSQQVKAHPHTRNLCCSSQGTTQRTKHAQSTRHTARSKAKRTNTHAAWQ